SLLATIGPKSRNLCVARRGTLESAFAQMISRAVTAVAALTALLVLVGMWFRVHYGVDFTDEAFYLVMPLRFVLGDRPFVDELNVAQTAGVVAWPFVGTFYKLTGGTAGIVLAARVMLLAIQSGVGLVVYR